MSSAFSDRFLRSLPSFPTVLAFSVFLRVGLIFYSEWHDAHSVVKYTDVDYRVFSDATHFVLHPGPEYHYNRAQGLLSRWFVIGDPYTRETYRYTPLLAILLAPNEWVHGSFGKFLFAACDILAGILIHKLLTSVILGPQKQTQSSSPSRSAPHPHGFSSVDEEPSVAIRSLEPSSRPMTDRRPQEARTESEEIYREERMQREIKERSQIPLGSDPPPNHVSSGPTHPFGANSVTTLPSANNSADHFSQRRSIQTTSLTTFPPPSGPVSSFSLSSSSPPKTSSDVAYEFSSDRRHALATLLASTHLLSPFVFTISTRGSSEAVLLLLVLATLFYALRARWDAAAVLLGVSVHWKIYPVVYGVACVSVIGREAYGAQSGKKNGKTLAVGEWERVLVNPETLRFATISAGTFFALGFAMYSVWGYPFLHETYLYHLHRLDHRHNFSPYFYLIYLSYPGLPSPPSVDGSTAQWLWHSVVHSPLTSFGPQMILSLGTGVAFAKRREDLPFAWFVQTVCFVVFNKVCTSQYFLWYLVFLPLLIPRLSMSTTRAVTYIAVWMGTQALWLSQAFRLEFLGEDVFRRLWACGLLYLLGHCWVLAGLMEAYGRS